MLKNSKRLTQTLMRSITTKQIETAKGRLTSNQIQKVDFIAQKLFELTPIEQEYVFAQLQNQHEVLNMDIGYIDFDRNMSIMLAQGFLNRKVRRVFEGKGNAKKIAG